MPATIHVACLPDQLPDSWQQVETAVVIDTLRFTTTACQALTAGASQIAVAAEVETARAMASQSPDGLLCGERLCRPIPGFQLGNSPYEYTSSAVAGRPLVFTTTNGTRAVQAAAPAQRILLSGLVNRTATAQLLVDSDAWIICSGTDGEIAGEDILAAGAIISALLVREPGTRLGNDAAIIATDAWSQFENIQPSQRWPAIVESLQRFAGGRNLVDNGYARDLQFAAQVDSLSVVPRNLPNSKERFTA